MKKKKSLANAMINNADLWKDKTSSASYYKLHQ